MSDRPILDLDALEVEADDIPFEFRFAKQTYVLPARIDVRAIAKLDAGLLDEFLRLLLGPEQWDRIVAAPQSFDDRQFAKLLNAYFEHLGVPDAGNFVVSTGLPKRTVEPSKRTSSASTVSGSRTSPRARSVGGDSKSSSKRSPATR